MLTLWRDLCNPGHCEVKKMDTILIAGAGPTGLILALALTQLGIRVRIIDKALEPGTTSRALVVHARTLEFYRLLGISDAVLKEAFRFAAINIWALGKRRGRAEIGDIGEGLSAFPYLVVFPQDEHEKFLISELKKLGVELERGTELIETYQDSKQVTATLKLKNGSQEKFQTPYLAGCDGSHSIVRKSLNIEFSGSQYQQLFYVADIESESELTNGELHLAIDKSDFLAIFPLKGKNRGRLIGILTTENDTKKNELKWEDVKHEAINNLGLKLSKLNWFSTYKVHHRLASEFSRGRIFLLGDAGHIHSPVGGQGMNTGIGDAFNLAWKLAAVLQKQADKKILLSYEPERKAFAKKLVATTDRAFTIVSSTGRLARFVRLNIIPVVVPRLMKIRPFRKFMFRMVSQISIHYRNSPLSVGMVGSLHAGDRLPWLRDNDSAFTYFGWQVHVYGAPAEDLSVLCNSLGIKLSVFKWRRDFSKSGFTEDAAYLIRPDLHIGCVLPEGRAQKIRDYFNGVVIGSAKTFEASREPRRRPDINA